MRFAFADASFIMPAVLGEQELLQRVQALRGELAGAQLVTSNGVLDEVLARASRMGAAVRADAAKAVREILADTARYTVVFTTRDLFEQGLALYVARPDQRYSHVDCVSMAIMDEIGIEHVLTFDRDFHGEGRYVVLPGSG